MLPITPSSLLLVSSAAETAPISFADQCPSPLSMRFSLSRAVEKAYPELPGPNIIKALERPSCFRLQTKPSLSSTENPFSVPSKCCSRGCPYLLCSASLATLRRSPSWEISSKRWLPMLSSRTGTFRDSWLELHRPLSPQLPWTPCPSFSFGLETARGGTTAD